MLLLWNLRNSATASLILGKCTSYVHSCSLFWLTYGLTFEIHLQNFEVISYDTYVKNLQRLSLGNLFTTERLLRWSDHAGTERWEKKKFLVNYRTIFMLNYKLFLKILAERIQSKMHKRQGIGQAACLQKTSRIDNLKDLRRVLTKSCGNKRWILMECVRNLGSLQY